MSELSRQKITFGEMRSSDLRGLLIYCAESNRGACLLQLIFHLIGVLVCRAEVAKPHTPEVSRIFGFLLGITVPALVAMTD